MYELEIRRGNHWSDDIGEPRTYETLLDTLMDLSRLSQLSELRNCRWRISNDHGFQREFDLSSECMWGVEVQLGGHIIDDSPPCNEFSEAVQWAFERVSQLSEREQGFVEVFPWTMSVEEYQE